jgi:hypothetical protein
MKRFASLLSVLVVLSCGVAVGQEFPAADERAAVEPPPAPPGQREPTLTPEMYRYISDLQRYGGPNDLVRQRAQREADLRKERLTAMRWYGYSNLRPMAGVTPFMGQTYGPRWVGNVRGNEFYWSDRGHHNTFYSPYLQSQGGVPTLR